MTHGLRFTRTLVLGFTIGMVALFPLAASASEDGWAHRSPETVPVDGWSVRTQAAPVVDGWAHRSSDSPRLATVTDGWAAGSSDAPQTAGVKDGFQVSLVQVPHPEAIKDGFEVAGLELPQPATATQTAPAPRRPSMTTGDLVGLALAAASLAAILTGMSITFYRHRHHAV